MRAHDFKDANPALECVFCQVSQHRALSKATYKESSLNPWRGLHFQVQFECAILTFPLSVTARFSFATEPSAAAGFCCDVSGTHHEP